MKGRKEKKDFKMMSKLEQLHGKVVTFTNVGNRGEEGSLGVGGTVSFVRNTLVTGQQDREVRTQERGASLSTVAKTMERKKGSR